MIDIVISDTVARALHEKLPVVALESTVITHGLPYPENATLAKDMEMEISESGAIPATIGVLDGRICVGLDDEQLDQLAKPGTSHKISSRDLAAAVIKGWSGGTTVAGTMAVSSKVGIRVFATGGIGGVHRNAPFDISADLPQLARTPIIVVCAGAKAILDLPATVEYLETAGVPVVGYQTDEFPAFYSRESGLPVGVSLDTPMEIARLATAHWKLGAESAILVVHPLSVEEALNSKAVEKEIQQALKEMQQSGIHGQQVTPYLLKRVTELTGGASMKANLALLRNNAHLAAEISKALVSI